MYVKMCKKIDSESTLTVEEIEILPPVYFKLKDYFNSIKLEGIMKLFLGF